MADATTLASVSRAHRAGGGQARCLLGDLPREILTAVVTCLHPCGSSLQRLRCTCKFTRWWLQRFVRLQREVYFAFFAMKRLGDAVLAPQSLQCPKRTWQRYVGTTVHDAYYGMRRGWRARAHRALGNALKAYATSIAPRRRVAYRPLALHQLVVARVARPPGGRC